MELRRTRAGGSLNDVSKLERRLRQAFPDDSSLSGIKGQSWRYKMFGLTADGQNSATLNESDPRVAELLAIAKAKKDEDMKMVVPAFLAPLCASLPRNVYSATAEADVDHVLATFITMPMPAPPPGYKEEKEKEKEGGEDASNDADESLDSDEPAKKRKRES